MENYRVGGIVSTDESELGQVNATSHQPADELRASLTNMNIGDLSGVVVRLTLPFNLFTGINLDCNKKITLCASSIEGSSTAG